MNEAGVNDSKDSGEAQAENTAKQIDLFGAELPSVEQINELAEQVCASQQKSADFGALLDEKATSNSNSLAVGIGMYIIGRLEEAEEKLKKAGKSAEKYLYLARTQRKMTQYNKAIKNLDKAIEANGDKLVISLEKTAAYRGAKELEKAENELKSCANFENISAEYHYQLARILEAKGLYEQAISNYKQACELSPEHKKAMFHLAYRCDLCGEEQAAIDYYKQLATSKPVHVNALFNLAVLYEDNEKFDKASQCIDKIIEYHPNNSKAIALKKDIDSSKTMYYDEENEKKKDKQHQILATPISDFELSVRSRNCLKKMKIFTLGDLLKISEAELLSYKNFGETSLYEIKNILTSKALYLGMSLDDESFNQTTEQNDATPEDQMLLGKTIDDLQLSVRAHKCVQNLSIKTLGELVRRTEAELLGCKNFGVTSLNEIKKSLVDLGLSLRKLE